MKKHTTVTITLKMLEDARACWSGQASAEPFLPATISTDPEQNLDLAIELAQSEAGKHVTWLDDAIGNSSYSCTCTSCLNDGGDARGKLYDTGEDPTIIAQVLAAVADAIATKGGR